MRKAAIFTALILLLVFSVAPALANGIPSLPHAFYGNVTVNGAPAADGTQVSATVDNGTVITNAQNPTTTVGGSYGVDNPRLLVQGDITPGATITFHVTNANGTAIGGTAAFEAGGGPTSKDLAVNITVPPPPPPPGPGGGGGIPTPTIGTNLFGTQQTFNTNSSGILQQQIEATSTDGKMTITIPAGTKCLDKDGNPLSSMTTTVVSPPAPPENANVIGLSYDFGPDGATFDPPFTITWSYDPDDLPEGVAEEDLVIAYYDEATGQWVELACTVDTVNNTITASIAHFTTFTVIGKTKPAVFSLSALTISPAEVASGEEVNISLSVANTGGIEGSYAAVLNINDTKEDEKSITIAAGSSQTVSFSVVKEEAGSYNVAVNGLSGSFTVLAPPEPTPTPPEPTPTPPEPAPTPPEPAPTPPTPTPTPEGVTPPVVGPNWPLIGGIIGGGIIVVILVILLVRRRSK